MCITESLDATRQVNSILDRGRGVTDPPNERVQRGSLTFRLKIVRAGDKPRRAPLLLGMWAARAHHDGSERWIYLTRPARITPVTGATSAARESVARVRAHPAHRQTELQPSRQFASFSTPQLSAEATPSLPGSRQRLPRVTLAAVAEPVCLQQSSTANLPLRTSCSPASRKRSSPPPGERTHDATTDPTSRRRVGDQVVAGTRPRPPKNQGPHRLSSGS